MFQTLCSKGRSSKYLPTVNTRNFRERFPMILKHWVMVWSPGTSQKSLKTSIRITAHTQFELRIKFRKSRVMTFVVACYVLFSFLRTEPTQHTLLNKVYGYRFCCAFPGARISFCRCLKVGLLWFLPPTLSLKAILVFPKDDLEPPHRAQRTGQKHWSCGLYPQNSSSLDFLRNFTVVYEILHSFLCSLSCELEGNFYHRE